MTRRTENHGLSNCLGSIYCVDCGGVCSQDLLGDAGPYKPEQIPADMPGYRWDVEARGYRRIEVKP